MRILRIITRLNTGGPAIQAVALHERLSCWGHDCRLLAGLVGDNEQRDIETGAAGLLGVGFIPQLDREICPKDDFLSLGQIRNEIIDFRPDVVHTHMSKAGLLGRLAALTVRPRPKLVHTFHGHVFHSYFGRGRTWLFLSLEQWLSRKTDAVIAISDSQMEELRGYGMENLVTMPLGLDLGRFLGIKSFVHTPGKPLRIGLIGRLTAIKNPDLFFRFCGEAAKRFPVEISVIGEGELRNGIEDRGYELSGIRPVVRSVPHDLVHQVYEDLDIVVCSSLNEGTPVSLIEAMASGRLVVSVIAGGCKDLVGGMVFNKYDKNPEIGAAIALEWVLKTGIYEGFIKRMRKCVKETYSFARLVGDIESLYGELMKGKKNEIHR